MKFKVIVTPWYDFGVEAMVRTMDPDARLTRSGRIVAWITMEDIDDLSNAGVPFDIIY